VPLDRFFITLLPLIFLITILRSSILFTSQAPRVHDTQNIHVAHTHAGTESSLPSIPDDSATPNTPQTRRSPTNVC
jgi:hypothetical protein